MIERKDDWRQFLTWMINHATTATGYLAITLPHCVMSLWWNQYLVRIVNIILECIAIILLVYIAIKFRQCFHVSTSHTRATYRKLVQITNKYFRMLKNIRWQSFICMIFIIIYEMWNKPWVTSYFWGYLNVHSFVIFVWKHPECLRLSVNLKKRVYTLLSLLTVFWFKAILHDFWKLKFAQM